MKKVRLISPGREEITFDYDSNEPLTFDTLKNILQKQFNFKNILSYTFYHNKSQITRSTKISINANDTEQISEDPEHEINISYFSKIQFPIKSFPQTDYSFPFDFPLFISKNSENDSSLFYPPIEGPKCIMSGNTNLTSFVEDTIEQAASISSILGIDPTLENLAESLVNDNIDINAIRNLANNFGDDRLDRDESNSGMTKIQRRTRFGNLVQIQQGQTIEESIQNSKGNDKNNSNNQSKSSTSNSQNIIAKIKKKHKMSSRRHLFESNAHPEEEEKDNEDAFEEYDDEEEDLAEGIDEIMEMKENYEESMTPEIEQSVERLTKLGFDRNLVTPLLFMLGDEEKTMQFLQKAFDAMQA